MAARPASGKKSGAVPGWPPERAPSFPGRISRTRRASRTSTGAAVGVGVMATRPRPPGKKAGRPRGGPRNAPQVFQGGSLEPAAHHEHPLVPPSVSALWRPGRLPGKKWGGPGVAPGTRPKFPREDLLESAAHHTNIRWCRRRWRRYGGLAGPPGKKAGRSRGGPRNAPQVSQGGSLEPAAHHEHPLVPPQVSHFRQMPSRTRVKLPHSIHGSPS